MSVKVLLRDFGSEVQRERVNDDVLLYRVRVQQLLTPILILLGQD